MFCRIVINDADNSVLASAAVGQIPQNQSAAGTCTNQHSRSAIMFKMIPQLSCVAISIPEAANCHHHNHEINDGKTPGQSDLHQHADWNQQSIGNDDSQDDVSQFIDSGKFPQAAI